MCTCKDRKCADGVEKKTKAFGKKAGKKPPKDVKEKAKALRKKMNKCMKDLFKSAKPTAKPKTVDTVQKFDPAAVAELIKNASITNPDSTEIFAKVGPKAIPLLTAEWKKRCTQLGVPG